MAPKSKPYEQFGPYILFKKLETDALGDLWRAGRIDGSSIASVVALRRLPASHRDAMLTSIATARQVAPLLTGPSFVRDQVIDEISGTPFLAHDYAGGRSLRHIVDRARGAAGNTPNPIPIDQAILIAEKVALSLSTVAELRFAGERLSHGALLPHFVWITDDGEIRVAGQQLGKGLAASKSPDIARYLSPEYQQTGQSTKSSEVYSVGAILYLVVTGHEPPDPLSTSAFTAAVRGAKTMTGAPIPDDIRVILDKSLNIDPSKRYATVADMHHALSALTNGGKYSATTFNLAFYLSNLLRKELEGEALDREKEAKVNVAPYLDTQNDAAPPPPPVAEVAAALAAKPARSKMPMAIAAAVGIIAIGAALFFVFGAKHSTAQPVQRVATAVPSPPPVKKEIVIPAPIVSAPVTQTTPAAATATLDPAAQQKAFENAVEAKLHAEVMKLQAQYTKQLQATQSKNAPVAVAPAPVETPATNVAETRAQRSTDDRAPEPSAAQLDLQRQREAAKPAETGAPTTIPAPEPTPIQQQPAVVVPVPQIKEGDVVDVGALDVVPKRTRDPRVLYPPMAARQKIETNVLTSVLISENGEVIDVKILRGDPRFGFNDVAIQALRGARYSPGVKDGKRVKTWLPQIIQFKPAG